MPLADVADVRREPQHLRARQTGRPLQRAVSWARAAVTALTLASSCADPGPSIDEGETVVLVGAGDIADCLSHGDEATAALLDTIPGTVFTLGDNVYPHGSSEFFANCYEPTWGRHKARTRPAVGNHEYIGDSGSAYFQYFGAAAGEPGQGYYSYDVGEWHVIVLNTELDVGYGSTQYRWLLADLLRNQRRCMLAYMHHPRYSSDVSYADRRLMVIWSTMQRFGVDLAVAGHDHAYERFDPMTHVQTWAPNGIRQFVVGTGGADPNFAPTSKRAYGSVVRQEGVYGLLKLTLRPRSYSWEFIPSAGATFSDSGSAACRRTTPLPSWGVPLIELR